MANEPLKPTPMWKFQKEHIPNMVIAIIVVVLGVLAISSSGIYKFFGIVGIIAGSIYVGVLLNQPPAKYLKDREDS